MYHSQCCSTNAWQRIEGLSGYPKPARGIVPASDDPIPASEQIEARHEINEAITAVLAEQPFSSLKNISRVAHIPSSTVHSPLRQALGFTMRHLEWAPNILSERQKRKRVEISKAFLPTLGLQAAKPWHEIVKLDES
jgi:hypothetical protein